MNEQELRQTIAKNITRLRKLNNMTQAELAVRLNYSDKSVSKWERGDGLPDVYILTQMAALFGVSVNDMISNAPAIVPERLVRHDRRHRRLLVTALSAGLVWFIATLVYFFLKVFMPEADWLWMAFVFAVPVSAIVIVVFVHLWWGLIPQALSVSALAWGITVSIHMLALDFNVQNMPIIYAATAAFQVLIILWYLYLGVLRRNKLKHTAQEASRTAAESVGTDAEIINENHNNEAEG